MLSVIVPGENQIAQSIGGIEDNLRKGLFERVVGKSRDGSVF